MIEKRVQSNKEYIVTTTESTIQAQAASYNTKSNNDDSDDDDDGYRVDSKWAVYIITAPPSVSLLVLELEYIKVYCILHMHTTTYYYYYYYYYYHVGNM